MWGWKTVERLIEPSVMFDEAKEILQAEGFRLEKSHPSHAVLSSEGTQNPWTTALPDGAEVPIEIALAESNSGLYLQLRYATFCLFDTGDLNRFADKLMALLIADERDKDQDDLEETIDFPR